MSKEYTPIIASNGMCVPATLKVIIAQNKLDFNIEDIAKDLGIEIPKEFAKQYPNLVVNKNNQFYQPINKKEFSINNFFKKNKIPLTMKRYYLTDPAKIQTLIADKIKTNDIAICYDFPTTINKDAKWGHVALATKISKAKIDLLNSYICNKDQKYTISIELIAKAIKKHTKRKMAGIWIFEKNKK